MLLDNFIHLCLIILGEGWGHYFLNTCYIPAFVLNNKDTEFHDLKEVTAYWVRQDGDNWGSPLEYNRRSLTQS